MNEKLIVKGEIFYNWTFLKLEYCSFEYKYSSIRQLYELKSFSKKPIEEQLLDGIKKHFKYFITFISWIMDHVKILKVSFKPPPRSRCELAVCGGWNSCTRETTIKYGPWLGGDSSFSVSNSMIPIL